MFDSMKWSMCTPVTDSTVWTSNSWPAWLASRYRWSWLMEVPKVWSSDTL